MSKFNGAALGLITLLALTARAEAQTSCDKTCLLGILNGYEQHMQSHSAAGIATTADYRGTENYRPIPLGTGYFTRAGQIYHQIQVADPVSGQVAAIGMMNDGGRDAWFVLRLKVEPGNAISQSEMLLIHDGETSFLQTDRNVKLSPAYMQPIPPNERSSREDMIRDVDNFTDAWQYKDHSLFDFTPNCTFSENAVMLSEPGGTNCGDMLEYAGRRGIPGAGTSPDRGNPNTPIAPMTRADPSIGRPPLQGPWIRDRRVPIVDVEDGVVVAWHIQGGEPARPGEAIQYTRPNGGGFIMHSENHRRTAAENQRATAGGFRPPAGRPGGKGGPPRGMGGAAYMAGIFKIVDGKMVLIDHFEWEGGPNASGGFSDGPKF